MCVEKAHSDGAVKLLWRTNTTSFAYGSPTVSADGKTVIFPASGDANVYALDGDTGDVRWKRSMGTAQGSSQPALSADGSTVFVMGQDHSNCNQLVVALATADGSSIWPDTRPSRGSLSACGPPAALTMDGDGSLWVVTGKNVLVRMSSESGNVTLSCNASGFVGKDGNMGGVALARDGLLIAFPNNGGVMAIGA